MLSGILKVILVAPFSFILFLCEAYTYTLEKNKNEKMMFIKALVVIKIIRLITFIVSMLGYISGLLDFYMALHIRKYAKFFLNKFFLSEFRFIIIPAVPVLFLIYISYKLVNYLVNYKLIHRYNLILVSIEFTDLMIYNLYFDYSIIFLEFRPFVLNYDYTKIHHDIKAINGTEFYLKVLFLFYIYGVILLRIYYLRFKLRNN